MDDSGPSGGAWDARIAVALEVEGGRVGHVSIDSTRPVRASAVFHGRPIETALDLLPRVFSLCGVAQTHAGLAACEDALGIVAAPPQAAARQLLLLAETAREHHLRANLDWPRLLREEADVAAIAAVGDAAAQLGAALYPDGPWARPGGGRLRPDRAAATAAIDTLDEALAPYRIDGAHMDALLRWAQSRGTPAARLAAAVDDDGLADFGASPVTALPDLDRAELDAVLDADRNGAFLARPTWHGAVHETGPAARMGSHPLIADTVRHTGNGLLARLAARMVEMTAMPEKMREILPVLSDHDGSPVETTVAGSGIGAVEAARGRLVHRVEVGGGQVMRYQILAPTEWNFHAEGPLARGLAGAAAGPGLARNATLLVNALDPCVRCDVAVVEPGHA